MKFKKIMLIASIAIPSFSFAQTDLTISETQKNMSAGNQNCYVLLIPQTTLKDVISDWKKYIKKDAKSKPADYNGETIIQGAYCKNISPNLINISAVFLETSAGVQLSSWFSEGDAFISTQSNPDKSIAVQNYLHNFGVQEYKNAVSDQLSNEQSKQRDLEKIYYGFVKDQKRSESNISNHKKDIEKLQNKIKDEEANIQKAQINQANARADADKQKVNVQQVSYMLNNIK